MKRTVTENRERSAANGQALSKIRVATQTLKKELENIKSTLNEQTPETRREGFYVIRDEHK